MDFLKDVPIINIANAGLQGVFPELTLLESGLQVGDSITQGKWKDALGQAGIGVLSYGANIGTGKLLTKLNVGGLARGALGKIKGAF